MDEVMEKVGALEGAAGEPGLGGWTQVARIEEMLNQVLNLDGIKAVDCKADTAYMSTAAHKDVT